MRGNSRSENKLFEVLRKKGSENNDCMSKSGFLSNHAGGILGGISNSNDIDIKVYFKPTPSIFKPQMKSLFL